MASNHSEDGPGDDPDGVHGPDRVPVVDALHVVPHAVAVDLVGARALCDLEHPPVDVRGHAREHLRRRLAQALGPLLAHQVVVAPDAAGGEHHGLGGQVELPHLGAVALLASFDRVGLQDLAPHPGRRAAADGQLVDAVAEAQLDQAPGHGLAHAALERLDHAGPRAPGDVEARDRVAVPVGVVAPALGPARVGDPAHALAVQPRALLARAEPHVRLGPPARPFVLGPVERGGAHPVLERQLVGVLDAHAALLGAVDEHQPAERPERLAPQGALGLLVDQQHLLAGVGQLGGGHQAGQARAHHDHIGVHHSGLQAE